MSQPRPGAVVPACLLAWLVPGAGHLYLGRLHRGLALLGALGALFLLGVALDARLQFYTGFDDPLAVVISAGQVAAGLPYFVARALGYGADSELFKSVTYEYGLTYTAVAGLLNVLVILDAHDIACGRKP